MKISAKLLILALAVFIVVSSAMFFFKAMTTPPTQLEDVNEFSKVINEDIAHVSPSMSRDDLDSMFIWVLYELKAWNDNNYLSGSQYDELVGNFYQKYVPTFTEHMKKSLSRDTWGMTEKSYMDNQIAQIRSEKKRGNSGVPVVSEGSNIDKNMKDLETISKNYVDARSLVSRTNYVDNEDAEKRIKQSREYKANVYLNHSDLENKLSSFPGDVGDSHYNQVLALHRRMESWSSYSLSDIKSTYDQFEKTADNYDKAKFYGNGHPKSLSSMRSDAKADMKDAYDNKCYVSVNSNTGSYNTSTWSNGSGTQTYYVKTDHPDGYTVSALSSWFRVRERNGEKLVIAYDENNSGSSRNTFFNVNAGNKTCRVNVSQNSPKASARVTSINTVHNYMSGGVKGMNITVYFTTSDCSGRRLSVNLYFYHKNGNALRDSNRKYYTTDGYVATGQSYTPYSNSTSSSVTMFMPYSELHLPSGRYDLKFRADIYLNGNRLDYSNYEEFYVY